MFFLHQYFFTLTLQYFHKYATGCDMWHLELNTVNERLMTDKAAEDMQRPGTITSEFRGLQLT